MIAGSDARMAMTGGETEMRARRMARWIAAMRAQDYGTAWALSERELLARDPATRDDPSLPYHQRWVWDGRDYRGKHCLIRCYHGLGDTIQFARFLPLLAERAVTILVEAPPRLIGLLERMRDAAGVDNMLFAPFDEAQPLPPSECDMEITELPFALRATPADVPVPYLPAPRAILTPGTIGLCHGAGNWDSDRSIPPALLAPLCAQAACLSLAPGPVALNVLNPAGCPFDMEATAALVASCALVISVDTMIAHLAGAMGKPTWLLLQAEPDWRWPVTSDSTPWYPEMRIYRQVTPGDWRGIIDAVSRDLTLFTGLTGASEAL